VVAFFVLTGRVMFKNNKRYLVQLLCLVAIIATLVTPFAYAEPAQAIVTTYNHVIPFTITDTGGVARTYLPVQITYDVNGRLVAHGLVNATANNTYIDSSGAGNSPIGGGTAYDYMVSTDNFTIVIPSLPAYASVTVNLYTGYVPQQSLFPIITGDGGYITTSADTDLNITNTGNITHQGYFNPLSTGYLLNNSILTIQGTGAGSVRMQGGNASCESFVGTGYSTKAAGVVSPAGAQMSIETWAYFDGLGGWDVIIGDGDWSSTVRWVLLKNTTDKLYFFIYNVAGTGVAAAWTSTNSCVAGQWYHIVATYNAALGTRTNVYVNGVTWGGVDTGGGTNIAQPNTFMVLGAYRNVGVYAELMDGDIDEVRVSNIARTHAEAIAAYNGGNGIDYSVDANTISLWHLGEGVGNPSDSAGNNNLTNTNVTWVTTSPVRILHAITSIVTTAGEHTFMFYISGGIAGIKIDNNVATTSTFTGSLPTGGNFIWNTANIMPYCDYITVYKAGVQKLLYQPNTMLAGAVLPDRVDSGGLENGTITWGANSNLTITGGDIMSSQSSTSVGSTTVLLQSTFDYIGTYTTVYLSFEYGLTTSYGYYTTESAATFAQSFVVSLTGLQANTTYHYRALARFGAVYAYGEDITFTTIAYSYGGGSTSPLIVSVNVFRNYATTGDVLFVAEINCTYPPYYPIQDPKDYFQVQLLDINGVTILGASYLAYWGDRPESIYFSPTFVTANITWGSAYYIRLKGVTTTENISVTHLITSAEWKGYDLTNLDAWCISTAKNMEIVDGVTVGTYVTAVTSQGEVITDVAGAYFTIGIPGIGTIRPKLFTTAQIIPTAITGTDTNAWDKPEYAPGGMQSYLGVTLTNDLDTMAIPFGISGKDFTSGLVVVAMLGCVILVVSQTGGFGALGAAFIAIPLLWLGVYFRIVPIFILVIIVLIMGLMAIRQFVVKTV
jgi:hypothetical protein